MAFQDSSNEKQGPARGRTYLGGKKPQPGGSTKKKPVADVDSGFKSGFSADPGGNPSLGYTANISPARKSRGSVGNTRGTSPSYVSGLSRATSGTTTPPSGFVWETDPSRKRGYSMFDGSSASAALDGSSGGVSRGTESRSGSKALNGKGTSARSNTGVMRGTSVGSSSLVTNTSCQNAPVGQKGKLLWMMHPSPDTSLMSTDGLQRPKTPQNTPVWAVTPPSGLPTGQVGTSPLHVSEVRNRLQSDSKNWTPDFIHRKINNNPLTIVSRVNKRGQFTIQSRVSRATGKHIAISTDFEEDADASVGGGPVPDLEYQLDVIPRSDDAATCGIANLEPGATVCVRKGPQAYVNACSE